MNHITPPIPLAHAVEIDALYADSVYTVTQLARIYHTTRWRIYRIIDPTPLTPFKRTEWQKARRRVRRS